LDIGAFRLSNSGIAADTLRSGLRGIEHKQPMTNSAISYMRVSAGPTGSCSKLGHDLAYMIDISDGFTHIEVQPEPIPMAATYANGENKVETVAPASPTGARVILEFVREAPIPPNRVIRAFYDIAGNGALREALGTPELTHTKPNSNGGVSYYYRLSYWIPARWIMRFTQS
jgi:hypothetical protein